MTPSRTVIGSLALGVVFACTDATSPSVDARPYPTLPARHMTGDQLGAGFGTPTIDGVFAAGEWAAAGTLSFPVKLPDGNTTPGTWYAMNDGVNLYLAMRFARSVADPGNSFVVEFDNDADGTIEDGNDVIVFNPTVGLVDDHRNANGTAPSDVSVGGTNDGSGVFSNDGTWATYEISHPLNSADDAYDFSLSPGGVVGGLVSIRIIGANGAIADTYFPGPSISAFATIQLAGNAPDIWLKDYVSMGTSVSMGYASEGVWSGSQVNAWPAQLASMAGYTMRLPLIAWPGCRSPFKAPLSTGVRESGEPVTTADSLLSCAPNGPGVTLPAANVAINAARTIHALTVTPENTTDKGNKGLISRVLPPNTTQVMAMQMQNPALVSVEFGANEMLGVRSGAVIPNVTYVPVTTWRPIYDEVTAKARAATSGGGVLVGLIKDVASFPAFRTGAEFWADRAMLLAAFHVQVDANCDQNADLQLVPIKIPTAVANGDARRKAQLPPFVLSCAPGPRGTQDLVLDAGERKFVQSLLNEMNAHIRRRAEQLGFAHFELEALYGLPNVKPTFSSLALMTTSSPYGPYISLDGFHPTALGQTVLAQAAAHALNTTYGMNLNMLPVMAMVR